MSSEKGKEWNQKVYGLWRKYILRGGKPEEYFRTAWVSILVITIMSVSSIIGSYYFSNYIAGLIFSAVVACCIVGYIYIRNQALVRLTLTSRYILGICVEKITVPKGGVPRALTLQSKEGHEGARDGRIKGILRGEEIEYAYPYSLISRPRYLPAHSLAS
jgi:hypothetical protein